MTAFCWAIAGHYQVTQGLTLPPYLRFGCYQRECIKCALVRLPEVAGGLPFTLGKNFNSFKQLTQCNTQLSLSIFSYAIFPQCTYSPRHEVNGPAYQARVSSNCRAVISGARV